MRKNKLLLFSELTCNISESRWNSHLRNRSDVADEIDSGGIDRQDTSPFCLVEALEQSHLVRREARAFAFFGQEPLHLAPKPAQLTP